MTEREYRFVGGPWAGERHVMDGRREWYVPIPELPTAMVEPLSLTDYPGIKVAVYERSGDYPAEWFYRFRGIERR